MKSTKQFHPKIISSGIQFKAEKSLQRLEKYLDQNGLSGYDPYDALNSTILSAFSMKSKYLKIAFTQAFKISPLNLRPFFCVRKGLNPKGMGLFLTAYLKLYRMTNDNKYLNKIELILSILEKYRSPSYSGYCWGYNFDWQSRSGFLPKYTPTIVNTVFIAHAYLDAYEILGDKRFLSIVESCSRFILNDLNIQQHNDSLCFSYTPIGYNCVYNATLLGSGLLARLYSYNKENKLLDYAKRSAQYVAGKQKLNGSWTYADTEYQGWIDSHHTGFVLEGLYNYLHYSNDPDYWPHLRKGLDYYKRHFFLSDGYPMFYNDRPYPVDVHCPAQAIVTFSRLKTIEDNHILLDSIVRWLIEHMQDSRGYFYYRKEKFFTNKISYIRWSQAWVFHALTTYVQNKQELK